MQHTGSEGPLNDDIVATERTLREEIATKIERHIDPEWPNDTISNAYQHAADIARHGYDCGEGCGHGD